MSSGRRAVSSARSKPEMADATENQPETADATVEVPELSDASLAEDDTAAAIEAVLAVEADTGAPAALSLPDDGGGATAQDEPVTAGSADDPASSETEPDKPTGPPTAVSLRLLPETFVSSVRTTPHFYAPEVPRSEEHTSELQSLMRISYAVFCL